MRRHASRWWCLQARSKKPCANEVLAVIVSCWGSARCWPSSKQLVGLFARLWFHGSAAIQRVDVVLGYEAHAVHCVALSQDLVGVELRSSFEDLFGVSRYGDVFIVLIRASSLVCPLFGDDDFLGWVEVVASLELGPGFVAHGMSDGRELLAFLDGLADDLATSGLFWFGPESSRLFEIVSTLSEPRNVDIDFFLEFARAREVGSGRDLVA